MIINDEIVTTDVPPCNTLMCFNLNTKVHINDLKFCLYELFSIYGKIIDIVASKKEKKNRGNAFVVFSNITSSTSAFRSMKGFIFLGRPLGISFAKTKSAMVALLDGTYQFKKRTPMSYDSIDTQMNENNLADTNMLSKLQYKSIGVTLFVENLPPFINEAALSILFKQYPGFIETRLIQGRSVAFVDFQNELQAEVAMRGLNNFLITPQDALKISLAKT